MSTIYMWYAGFQSPPSSCCDILFQTFPMSILLSKIHCFGSFLPKNHTKSVLLPTGKPSVVYSGSGPGPYILGHSGPGRKIRKSYIKKIRCVHCTVFTQPGLTGSGSTTLGKPEVVDFVDSVTVAKTIWEENEKHFLWIVPPVGKNHMMFHKASERKSLTNATKSR